MASLARIFFISYGASAIYATPASTPAARASPIVVGQTMLAGSQDPRVGSTGWSLVSHGIAEKLFTVDQHGEIVGQVAESVSQVSELVWEVTLKAGYKFSDGTSVNAQHVADCLTELNAVNSAASSTLGAMTVTAPSDLVVRIASERATHIMNSVLAGWAFPIYYKVGGNFVFTGPYAVDHFAASHIDLLPNRYYPRADERPLVQLKKFADGDALAAAVTSNTVDVGFHLPIHSLPAVRSAAGVHVVSFEVGYQYMMHHNIRRPTMADVRVRRAIDLAINRIQLTDALSGGHATRSLFPDNSPYYSDESDPNSDAAAAAALLDAAGWTLSNGKRSRGGQDLTIKLVAYPQRPGLAIMQPVIAQSLAALGITVESVLTSGASWDQLDALMAAYDYDLLMWAQHTLPSGDPAHFLDSFFGSAGGSNYAGFSSSSVDSQLDALSLVDDHLQRVAATKAVHDAILSEVPVSNLVTPMWHVSLSDRVKDSYVPWGSDYYVIRADEFLSLHLTPAARASPIMVGQTMLAGSQDPRVGSTGWSLVSHGIAEKLFTVDQHGEIVGQVAESVSQVSELVWEVTLKAGYKFSDGTSVNAQHVADCLTELNAVNSAASSTLGAMTVTAPSDLVVRIASERATHIMNSVLAGWAFPIYYKVGGTFVFTGPYAVDHFAASHIDLLPNRYYPRADERSPVQLKKFADGDALASAVTSNTVDVGFHLPIHSLPAVRSAAGVHVVSFEVGYQYMLHHNIRRPTMADVRVRRAIDLAINRTSLADALSGGHATRSLFPDNSPYYSDESDPNSDAAAAAALLDAAGWTLSNGKRSRGGQDLTIKLVAYPQRPGLAIMQPVIAQSLAALGITVESVLTSGASWDQLDALMAAYDYDLLMWAQHTLPSGDPAHFLDSFFGSAGGSNYAGFSSSSVDSQLDALSLVDDHLQRVAATKAVHDAILSEVPVSNLVTPMWHVSLSDRVKDSYVPWGSDYYVIRADEFLSWKNQALFHGWVENWQSAANAAGWAAPALRFSTCTAAHAAADNQRRLTSARQRRKPTLQVLDGSSFKRHSTGPA